MNNCPVERTLALISDTRNLWLYEEVSISYEKAIIPRIGENVERGNNKHYDLERPNWNKQCWMLNAFDISSFSSTLQLERKWFRQTNMWTKYNLANLVAIKSKLIFRHCPATHNNVRKNKLLF